MILTAIAKAMPGTYPRNHTFGLFILLQPGVYFSAKTDALACSHLSGSDLVPPLREGLSPEKQVVSEILFFASRPLVFANHMNEV